MAVYVPDTAVGGIVITIVGFHDVEFATSTVPRVAKAVRGTARVTACANESWPGVRTARPVDAVAGPDQYAIEALPIVSGDVPEPVTKSVEEAVAVQVTAKALSSVTVTAPN